MRTFDFAPLYRSTFGFDRMFSMLDQLGGVEGSVRSYLPYNIERASENAYRISVAVAGFWPGARRGVLHQCDRPCGCVKTLPV